MLYHWRSSKVFDHWHAANCLIQPTHPSQWRQGSPQVCIIQWQGSLCYLWLHRWWAKGWESLVWTASLDSDLFSQQRPSVTKKSSVSYTCNKKKICSYQQVLLEVRHTARKKSSWKMHGTLKILSWVLLCDPQECALLSWAQSKVVCFHLFTLLLFPGVAVVPQSVFMQTGSRGHRITEQIELEGTYRVI